MAKRDAEFYRYVTFDLMGDIPGITSRSMFGGYGIYQYGNFFALIADGELYFKVDDTTYKDYENRGSHPFRYSKGPKEVTLGYWTLPEQIMENKEALLDWVERAVIVAKKAKAPKVRSVRGAEKARKVGPRKRR